MKFDISHSDLGFYTAIVYITRDFFLQSAREIFLVTSNYPQTLEQEAEVNDFRITMEDWVAENAQGDVQFQQQFKSWFIGFADPRDAMQFKLRFA